MSLDTSKLQNLRRSGQKTTARCPVCAEVGHDQKGEHLVINVDGRFGCVVYPGDSADAKEHRKRIFSLCGDRETKPLIIHRPKETAVLGRQGRRVEHHLVDAPLKTGLLGRLGRVFETHLKRRLEIERDVLPVADQNDNERAVLAVPKPEVTPN